MIARSPVVSDADGSLLDVGSIPASPFLAWFLLNLLSSWEMDLTGQHTAHQWLRLGAHKWCCDGPFVPPNGVGLWRAQLFESFVAWSMPTWPQVFLLFFISTSFLFILFYVFFYAWLDVTFLWVRFNILMQTKYVATWMHTWTRCLTLIVGSS